MPLPTLPEQVGDAAGLLGLLLALVTLFTTEQARRLDDERTREGGARAETMAQVRWLSVGLAAVTAAAVGFLAPLVLDVFQAFGDDGWAPVLGVFVLTYLLLVALLVWQISLAARAHL